MKDEELIKKGWMGPQEEMTETEREAKEAYRQRQFEEFDVKFHKHEEPEREVETSPEDV